MKVTIGDRWKLYNPIQLPGMQFLGEVVRAPGDVGALVRVEGTGMLVQMNAGTLRSLPQREANVALLTARFFADCLTDGRQPNEESLRAWLWFTCPANMRPEVGPAIVADPRFIKPKGGQT